MNIFDRKAKILQKERAALREDYELAEYIKEEVGWRTADRVFDIKRTFKNAVELGAGRGYVSRHFLPDSVEKITLCDTSQTHLDKAIVGDGVKFEKVVMDEENFEFPDNSIDLLVSSLALHWVNDLPGCFDRVMRCLQPDGGRCLGAPRAASRARGAARSPISPSHPSSPPEGLVSAGSSRTQQAAPAAGGARRMRWTKSMNENALRAYYKAKGEETVGIAYRSRMHCFFAELEPSIPVTEQHLADRIRYIMRSKIFDDAELERLQREAIPSSNESAMAGDAAPHSTDQHPHVEAAMDLPAVVDSNVDEIVSHELEQMRSILEEAILETRSTPLEIRPRLPRIPLSKRNRAVVRALNPMLVTYLEASRDLCETDSILFGAAVAVCRIIGAKLPMAGRATTQSSAIPAWRKIIEDRVAKARALTGRLTSFRSGNNRPRILRTVRMAFAGTNISLSQPDITQKLTERIDDLKQEVKAVQPESSLPE
ncbi:unnamed protein product [Parnassius apollo]|uniref:Arginine-hydroxylase NDUFAF5, mitochondrial n=1 Tax=Parnassius apollo TaxID=110799 RepID=A0A8S3WAI1_PARAO|nr:unnamed protein product [Parnassius apollo]